MIGDGKKLQMQLNYEKRNLKSFLKKGLNIKFLMQFVLMLQFNSILQL